MQSLRKESKRERERERLDESALTYKEQGMEQRKKEREREH